MLRFGLLLLTSGCVVPESLVDRLLDADGDGQRTEVVGGEDCDDQDPNVRAGIAEVCGNGIDDDCDGQTDDRGDGALHGYVDADGDGFGNLDREVVACALGEGVVERSGDCDDTRTDVHPGAREDCLNGHDDDCDGSIDDAEDQRPFWPDQDGDGHGDAEAVPVTACSAPPGHAIRGGDCNDDDEDAHEGATEIPYDAVDQACDGGDDFDADGDGVQVDPAFAPYAILDLNYRPTGPLDCDDLDPAVRPGAQEIAYDGIDGDCDGSDDFDQDGDGHRALGYGGEDCDDLDDDVNPDAVEVVYDGVDDDCDPANDDDADGDGFASDQHGGTDCDDLDPNNWVSCPTCADQDRDGRFSGCDAYATLPFDCDDTSALVWASCATCADRDLDGAPDGCDAYGGTVEDCDDADPDVTRSCGLCRDADGDGYWHGCDAYTVHPFDCDDTLTNAWTTCARCTDADGDRWGVGSSCQAPVDCDDDEPDAWASCASCFDGDGDGSRVGCDRYTVTPIDCDDADPAVDGSLAEVLDDGLDQDCDGRDLLVDEAHGLFVSPFGDDGPTCGSRAFPCRSLELAAPLAFETGKVLFAAGGTYGRFDTRVSVYGGFDPVSWDRDPDVWVTTVVASEGSGIVALGAKVDVDGVEVVDGESGDSVQLLLQSSFAMNLVNSTLSAVGWHRVCRLIHVANGHSLAVQSSRLRGCNASDETTGIFAHMDGLPFAAVRLLDSEVSTDVASETSRNRSLRLALASFTIDGSRISASGGSATTAIEASTGFEDGIRLIRSTIRSTGMPGVYGTTAVLSRPHGTLLSYRTEIVVEGSERATAIELNSSSSTSPNLTAFTYASASVASGTTSVAALRVFSYGATQPMAVSTVASSFIARGESGFGITSGPATSFDLTDTLALGSQAAIESQAAQWHIATTHLDAPCNVVSNAICIVPDEPTLAECLWSGCQSVTDPSTGDSQLDPTSPFGIAPSSTSPLLGRGTGANWDPSLPHVDLYGVPRSSAGGNDIGATERSGP